MTRSAPTECGLSAPQPRVWLVFRIVLLALMVTLSATIVLITEDGDVRLINIFICVLSTGLLIARVLAFRRKRKTTVDGRRSRSDVDR